MPSTVWEVVTAGRLSRRKPFLPPTQGRDRAAIGTALETVGLADRAKHTVSTLSGGQQQRVLMARTLAGEPDLLVLDEPNAGVDHASQQAIAEAMTRMVGQGATLVVVLHELGPFAPLIERTVEMASGRIVYDGPPQPADARPRAPPPAAPAIRRAARPRPARGVLMFDILFAPFMVKALIAAAVTGLAAPAIGTYLVQRKLSLMGDGIGHICVTGVALGLLTGTSPTLTAVLIAILGALLIELIRVTGRTSGDVALALLFYGGISGGLVIVSLAGNGVLSLQSYLFGSIVSMQTSDVIVSVVLAALVIGLSLVAAAAVVRGRQRRGLRAHDRHPGRLLQRADLGARRSHRVRRDAHRRPAPGERADGGAGGDRPAVHPRLPGHHAQRHGARRRCRAGRRHDQRVRRRTRRAPPSC